MRIATLAFLLFTTSSILGEDWPQLQFDSGHSGNAPDRTIEPGSLGLVGAVPFSDGLYSSPVIADGNLYLVSGLGVISVVPAGDEFELAHQYALGEGVQVTPAIDADTIYFRGEKYLWAFRRAE